jgi:hypothetical protein
MVGVMHPDLAKRAEVILRSAGARSPIAIDRQAMG